MRKQFHLIFIIIINVSIYSQVVIKDEIFLDEIEVYKDETESAGLSMPFYGKVRETIYSVYNIVCNNARNELVVNNS